jgi:branched-subunit amino acid transport protein
MTWAAILILAAGVYATKALGPLAMRRRRLPPEGSTIAGLVAVPMLAALVVVQTVTSGPVVEPRLAAVTLAAVAVWRGAPFIVAVVLAGATSALLHAIT